jgi:hypothetical protein
VVWCTDTPCVGLVYRYALCRVGCTGTPYIGLGVPVRLLCFWRMYFYLMWHVYRCRGFCAVLGVSYIARQTRRFEVVMQYDFYKRVDLGGCVPGCTAAPCKRVECPNKCVCGNIVQQCTVTASDGCCSQCVAMFERGSGSRLAFVGSQPDQCPICLESGWKEGVRLSSCKHCVCLGCFKELVAASCPCQPPSNGSVPAGKCPVCRAPWQSSVFEMPGVGRAGGLR